MREGSVGESSVHETSGRETSMREIREAAFDPETLDAMAQAFDTAWKFVQTCKDERDPEPSVARDMLARSVVAAASDGVRTKVDLAKEAIRRHRVEILGDVTSARRRF